MTDSPDQLRAEISRLNKGLKRAQRRVGQVQRVAAASEELAIQSKNAALRTNEQLRELVDELREAKLAAEQASESKSRFLATMSHEIRTPMNGVIGSLELLEQTGLTQDQLHLAQLMKSSSTALVALINDILDFAKIEAGRIELERAPFNLTDLLEGVAGAQRTVANANGIELELELDPSIPRCVEGDAHRLRQILTNLISNAIKFTPEGSVRLLVSPAGGASVRFQVVDTGIGIHRDAMQQIFEAFTQEDSSTTRKYGGTGLGLAITKRLVTLMGSQLEVESVVDIGSTFSFTCELHPASELEGDAPSAHPKGALPARFANLDLSVLLVDDTAINRVITGKMLNKLGCRVDFAVNGREALERIAKNRYDVVLMDCCMPVMDGYEATAAVRALPADQSTVPIIALTAFAMAEDRDRCLRAGMDDYIAKPVKLRVLEESLIRLGKPAPGPASPPGAPGART